MYTFRPHSFHWTERKAGSCCHWEGRANNHICWSRPTRKLECLPRCGKLFQQPTLGHSFCLLLSTQDRTLDDDDERAILSWYPGVLRQCHRAPTSVIKVTPPLSSLLSTLRLSYTKLRDVSSLCDVVPTRRFTHLLLSFHPFRTTQFLYPVNMNFVCTRVRRMCQLDEIISCSIYICFFFKFFLRVQSICLVSWGQH